MPDTKSSIFLFQVSQFSTFSTSCFEVTVSFISVGKSNKILGLRVKKI